MAEDETTASKDHSAADDAGSSSSTTKPSGSPQADSAERAAGNGSSTSPKPKRRKVNHACVYCRRSHMTCDLERPCTRCIKRNIGHMCHDEPKEAVKRTKSGHATDADQQQVQQDDTSVRLATLAQQRQLDQQLLGESDAGIASSIRQTVPPPGGPSASLDALNGAGSASSFPTADELKLAGQNPFHDIHTYHPSYMFNAHEVTNEYNLLNDFLSTSLLDEGAMYGPGNDVQNLYGADLAAGNSGALNPGIQAIAPQATVVGTQATAQQQPVQQMLGPPLAPASSIRRPSSVAPTDKDQEKYYMTAADPTDEGERLNTLLKAKYEAGMLRPFNYVKGYARLNRYMEQHIRPDSRQKILKQLDMFRPKFRERMQSLTDVELVLVEMWFERCLMEYDRVFASMAIPACCWRRTGEIFRGNKEMAELIHVPIESLRDGKLAIHDIIAEEHLVSYWQKFGGIAFDKTQKAMLTSCSLKNPDIRSKDSHIPCCFSFTIRRDGHDIPSLIVGNFLPLNPNKT